MDISKSERSQIENEMIFRRFNENIGDNIVALDAMHIEDNNLDLMWDDTILLNFKCECSDETCDERIPVKLSVYNKIHENRSAFIVKPNHHIKEMNANY